MLKKKGSKWAGIMYFVLPNICFAYVPSSYWNNPEVDSADYDFMEEAKYTNRQWITLFVPTDSVHQFDVIKYKIEVELLPASPDNKIKGHTTIQAKSLVNGFNLLALDFIGMVVDSCKVNTQSALYTRSSNLLNINLGGNYNTGTYFTAEVFYHGLPQAGFYFDQNSYGTPVYYSFTQPYDSRYWFPCYDYPEDKAHCEVICTVPDNNFAVSNGQLYRVTNNQSGSKTYHWIEYYNIATYLISITVSNFVQIDTSLQFEEYELPVQYWVYPQDASKAAIDFKNTPAMIQFFSGLWGDYPFLADKYSMVQAELSGAMEHQTCTSWGIPITGDTRYEHVVAHELAHHWWGNWVTCHDYANIWLNEGFASYAEALWKEEKYGLSAFKNHMIAFEGNVFASRKGSVKYPIYNPPETYLFGTAVYKKGAWVLHMLRHILGDSIFQQGLAYYGLSHSYRTSTTEQFQAALEEFSGQDLDWFFDEWIYSPNYPIYKWSWVYTSFAGYYYLDINLGQKQDDPLVFRMPIEFKLSTAAKDTFFTVFDSLREQRFSMVLSSPPTGLIWDPNYKLLSADTLTTYPYLAGDVDGNRLVMLGDAIYLVNMLFYGFPLPTPPAAADVSGDCKISLADIIYLVNYVFGRGSPPRIGCP